MKKLLVSDYDETFHITREGLDENIKSVKRFRGAGNVFIFATGRSYTDFKWLESEFGIEYDMLILDHGALILDGEENILFSSSIDDNTVMAMKEDLRIEKCKRVFCTSGLEGRVDFDHGNIQKVNTWYDNEKDPVEVLDIIQKKYGGKVNAYLIPPESLEIITKTSAKEIAIEWVAKKLGICAENIYTAGDGYSDVAMVKKYNGYAVPNAVEPLKKAARGVVSTVTELIDMIMSE